MHAGAVLLHHLRAIKSAVGGGLDHKLNQGGAGHANNWTIKTQAQIDAAITNAIDNDSLAALKDYQRAHAMNNADAGFGNVENVAKRLA